MKYVGELRIFKGRVRVMRVIVAVIRVMMVVRVLKVLLVSLGTKSRLRMQGMKRFQDVDVECREDVKSWSGHCVALCGRY